MEKLPAWAAREKNDYDECCSTFVGCIWLAQLVSFVNLL